MLMVGVGYRKKLNLTINFYLNENISGQLDSFVSLKIHKLCIQLKYYKPLGGRGGGGI